MRSRRFAAALCAAAIVLAGCSGGSAFEDEPPAGEDPTPKAAPPVCPLTGLRPPRGVDLGRPAVAVKIENSPEARPQAGLDAADLVFEEIVEGGITRFMAVYHCGGIKKAGPVRSARFDDPKIARPFTRLLAYSGSNAIVDAELQRTGMISLNEKNGGAAFFRDPPGDLSTTHNLYVNVEKVRATAEKRRVRSPVEDIFRFGALPGAAKKARGVTLHFTASDTIEYRWQKGSRGKAWYRWEQGAPFMTQAGVQLSAPNLLVQLVNVDNSSKIVDVAGNPSPDIHLLGTGEALLFRDGRVVKARWKVPSEGAAPIYTTKSGEPLRFDRGRILIELLPSGKGAVKGSFSYR